MSEPVSLAPWQAVTLKNRFEHFGMFAGVAAGKTFTGSHFSINNIEEGEGLTGLIGANSYDQLSQATLRELFYWLDHYGYDYVIDQRPPLSWNAKKQFKTYKNVMTVKAKTHNHLVHIFTRVMSAPNPLRGVEFAWYWLDETRDTPENTHDVIISRMRESPTYRRGLITSTTNGEDWAYDRFVRRARPGQNLYGSMHVPTIKAVQYGIISQDYYNGMRATYSPLMAMQELDALHVNVRGGQAYYSFSEYNRARIAPWGDAFPDPARPLIVGCDFNYSPAPCVWMIGQLGPDLKDDYDGYWSDHIHWFGEIALGEVSTPQMARALVGRYPNFMYRIFGDSSGTRGTTSNAGQTDYLQLGQTIQELGGVFTIDQAQANPHIKDRVENMNRLAKNALGQTFLTYNPGACPLFDSDVKQVGWKRTVMMGRAKLDDGGNKRLTHASDAAGYACFKVLPPGKRGYVGISIGSPYAGLIA